MKRTGMRIDTRKRKRSRYLLAAGCLGALILPMTVSAALDYQNRKPRTKKVAVETVVLRASPSTKKARRHMPRPPTIRRVYRIVDDDQDLPDGSEIVDVEDGESPVVVGSGEDAGPGSARVSTAAISWGDEEESGPAESMAGGGEPDVTEVTISPPVPIRKKRKAVKLSSPPARTFASMAAARLGLSSADERPEDRWPPGRRMESAPGEEVTEVTDAEVAGTDEAGVVARTVQPVEQAVPVAADEDGSGVDTSGENVAEESALQVGSKAFMPVRSSPVLAVRSDEAAPEGVGSEEDVAREIVPDAGEEEELAPAGEDPAPEIASGEDGYGLEDVGEYVEVASEETSSSAWLTLRPREDRFAEVEQTSSWRNLFGLLSVKPKRAPTSLVGARNPERGPRKAHASARVEKVIKVTADAEAAGEEIAGIDEDEESPALLQLRRVREPLRSAPRVAAAPLEGEARMQLEPGEPTQPADPAESEPAPTPWLTLRTAGSAPAKAAILATPSRKTTAIRSAKREPELPSRVPDWSRMEQRTEGPRRTLPVKRMPVATAAIPRVEPPAVGADHLAALEAMIDEATTSPVEGWIPGPEEMIVAVPGSEGMAPAWAAPAVPVAAAADGAAAAPAWVAAGSVARGPGNGSPATPAWASQASGPDSQAARTTPSGAAPVPAAPVAAPGALHDTPGWDSSEDLSAPMERLAPEIEAYEDHVQAPPARPAPVLVGRGSPVGDSGLGHPAWPPPPLQLEPGRAPVPERPARFEPPAPVQIARSGPLIPATAPHPVLRAARPLPPGSAPTRILRLEVAGHDAVRREARAMLDELLSDPGAD